MEEEIGFKADPKDYKYIEGYYVRHSGYDLIYHTYHLVVDKKPELKLNLNEHKDHLWLKPGEALKLNLIEDEDMCIKWFYNLD